MKIGINLDKFVYDFKFFDWIKKSKLVELEKVNCKDDPVRPELDNKFRITHGRKIFGLKYKDSIEAVVCLAFTNDIPITVKELELMCEDASLVAQHREGQVGTIAVAYTLWSYKKGAGRKIMKELKKYVKKIHHLNKIVTLSPLTPVATHYHISNGARLIQVNPSSQNFEYKLK